MSESASTNESAIIRLEPGQPAPDFTLSDDQGNAVHLRDLLSNDVPGDGTPGDDSGSDARGDVSRRRVILYFYPAAMTPGCTTEACDFRDRLDRLTSAGYTVVGVSKDLPSKLARFRERDHLTFTLLSDPDLAVHKAYGAYGERKLYGKVHVGPIRSTFVIGATDDEGSGADGDGHASDGVIELARYNVRAKGHVDSLLKQLDKLD